MTVVLLDCKLHLKRTRDATWAPEKANCLRDVECCRPRLEGYQNWPAESQWEACISRRGELGAEDSGPIPLRGSGVRVELWSMTNWTAAWDDWCCASSFYNVMKSELGLQGHFFLVTLSESLQL